MLELRGEISVALEENVLWNYSNFHLINVYKLGEENEFKRGDFEKTIFLLIFYIYKQFFSIMKKYSFPGTVRKKFRKT